MTVHKSVLPKETIEGLNLKEGMMVVDATLGGGGHSLKILEKIGKEGTLIVIDRDKEALERFKNKIKDLKISEKNLITVWDNFSNLANILENLKIEKVDAILADFGLSSDQLDDNERGFSFNSDASLDMRMNQAQELSAREVVNNYPKKDLNKIIRDWGEEKFSQSIARNIEQKRKEKEIINVSELVEIISQSVPEKYKHQRIHFATRTFQAIRMEVNEELRSIEIFLESAIAKLKKEGRLVAISFHSGEDRIVKNIFKEAVVNCECPVEFPICSCTRRAQIKIITKKPIGATDKEIKENPRSRSAKLRIAQKI